MAARLDAARCCDACADRGAQLVGMVRLIGGADRGATRMARAPDVGRSAGTRCGLHRQRCLLRPVGRLARGSRRMGDHRGARPRRLRAVQVAGECASAGSRARRPARRVLRLLSPQRSDHGPSRDGDQVRRLGGSPAISRPAIGQYDIMRAQNFAVVSWWQKFIPDTFDNVPKREGSVPGIPVSVAQFPAQVSGRQDPEIRPARRQDLEVSVELINRTHLGTDLFRPYSVESLENTLDEGFWGGSPNKTGNPSLDWWASIYGWADYFVLEEAGRIRACAGLWDRGRDMRERWRRIGGVEERTIANACVLDFGLQKAVSPRWRGCCKPSS